MVRVPICPKCSATIHAGAAAGCPACGYSLTRADEIFGRGQVEFTRVLDAAGALTHQERLELMSCLANLERRIPPVALGVYITDDGHLEDFRTHAHWILNHAHIHHPSFGKREQARAVEDAEIRELAPGERIVPELPPSPIERLFKNIANAFRDWLHPIPPPVSQEWMLILVLDVQLEVACFSWGYMLDPYVNPDSINSCIIRARLRFREREMLAGLKSVMRAAVSQIASGSRRAARKISPYLGSVTATLAVLSLALSVPLAQARQNTGGAGGTEAAAAGAEADAIAVDPEAEAIAVDPEADAIAVDPEAEAIAVDPEADAIAVDPDAPAPSVTPLPSPLPPSLDSAAVPADIPSPAAHSAETAATHPAGVTGAVDTAGAAGATGAPGTPAVPAADSLATPADSPPTPPAPTNGYALPADWTEQDYRMLMAGEMLQGYNALMPQPREEKTAPRKTSSTTGSRKKSPESDKIVPAHYTPAYTQPPANGLIDPQHLLSTAESNDVIHVLRQANAHANYRIHVALFKAGQNIPPELSATNLVTSSSEPCVYTALICCNVGDARQVELGYSEIKPTDEQRHQWLLAARTAAAACGGGVESIIAAIYSVQSSIDPVSGNFHPITPGETHKLPLIQLPMKPQEDGQKIGIREKIEQFVTDGTNQTLFAILGMVLATVLAIAGLFALRNRSARLLRSERDLRLESPYGAGVSRHVRYLEGKEAPKEKTLF